LRYTLLDIDGPRPWPISMSATTVFGNRMEDFDDVNPDS
jgi:hypothetical protein